MADLDDFFAKKDRKKKPTKKFVTPEDLSKKLEITTPKVADVKSKKEQPQKSSDSNENEAEIDQNVAPEVRIKCVNFAVDKFTKKFYSIFVRFR